MAALIHDFTLASCFIMLLVFLHQFDLMFKIYSLSWPAELCIYHFVTCMSNVTSLECQAIQCLLNYLHSPKYVTLASFAKVLSLFSYCDKMVHVLTPSAAPLRPKKKKGTPLLFYLLPCLVYEICSAVVGRWNNERVSCSSSETSIRGTS